MKKNTCFEKIKDKVFENYPKEYLCHLQFVVILAREMQRIKGGDCEIIDIASVGHDIGRKDGQDNKQHAEKGAIRIVKWLESIGYRNKSKIEKISLCVLMHNKNINFNSIEEEIVSNADALSKLRYHENFLLMCKKEDFLSKAKWGLKYVEKGFKGITFKDIRESNKELYQTLVDKYNKVINKKQPENPAF